MNQQTNILLLNLPMIDIAPIVCKVICIIQATEKEYSCHGSYCFWPVCLTADPSDPLESADQQLQRLETGMTNSKCGFNPHPSLSYTNCTYLVYGI